MCFCGRKMCNRHEITKSLLFKFHFKWNKYSELQIIIIIVILISRHSFSFVDGVKGNRSKVCDTHYSVGSWAKSRWKLERDSFHWVGSGLLLSIKWQYSTSQTKEMLEKGDEEDFARWIPWATKTQHGRTTSTFSHGTHNLCLLYCLCAN